MKYQQILKIAYLINKNADVSPEFLAEYTKGVKPDQPQAKAPAAAAPAATAPAPAAPVIDLSTPAARASAPRMPAPPAPPAPPQKTPEEVRNTEIRKKEFRQTNPQGPAELAKPSRLGPFGMVSDVITAIPRTLGPLWPSETGKNTPKFISEAALGTGGFFGTDLKPAAPEPSSAGNRVGRLIKNTVKGTGSFIGDASESSNASGFAKDVADSSGATELYNGAKSGARELFKPKPAQTAAPAQAQKDAMEKISKLLSPEGLKALAEQGKSKDWYKRLAVLNNDTTRAGVRTRLGIDPFTGIQTLKANKTELDLPAFYRRRRNG